MNDRSPAVFLSYASQDKEVAKKICDALRAAGVEVWFDQSELRGGDAWDQKIRRQIKECALFVPLITTNTNARPEGYFRLEWKLAVDRSHLMAEDAPFLFPIAVGAVSDATARVPDKFRDVQWTRLRLDETPAELAARVSRLLSGEQGTWSPEPASAGSGRKASDHVSGMKSFKWWMVFPVAGTIMGLLFAVTPIWRSINRPPRNQPPKVEAPVLPAANPTPAAPAVSEARRLADRGFGMSVEKYDSTMDDYTVAEDLLKRAIALAPDDGEIVARMAQLNLMFRNRGFDFSPERIAVGRQQAERAIRLAPESAEALMALHLAQRYTNNTAASFETLQKVVAVDPGHARALLFLGAAMISRGKPEEGYALYDRARKNPEWVPLADYFEFLREFNYRRFARADELVRRSYDAKASANTASGIALIHLTWKGDLDQAAKEIAAVPPELLTAPRVIVMTAQVHLHRRDPERVLRALDRLPDEFIQDSWFTGPKALLVGRAHALAGRESAARIAWESGLPIIDAKLKEKPGDAHFHRCRGELLAWLGRADEALAEARTVAEINRDNPGSWDQSEATIYAALGRADPVFPLLEKMADARQSVWPLTATLLRQDPRWDKLRSDLRFANLMQRADAADAKASSPASPMTAVAKSPARELAERVFTILNGLDVTREDLALAEDLAQQAMKLDSTDGDVWAAGADVHSVYGYRGWDTSAARREQMRVMAERAIRLAPTSVHARLVQAGAWISFNINRAEAEKMLRDILQEQPDHQFTLRFLALLVLNRGQLEEALALNERSAALPGGDPLALYNNGRYLLQAGRVDEAYSTLERSLAQKPFSSALVMKTLLEIYRKGDLAAAEATQRRIPATVLLEDRANYISGILRYYRRDAEGALRMWGSFPREAYADFQFDGPKGLLLGYAYELDGREAAAKIEWRSALAVADKRLAAAPSIAARHLDRAHLLACLGDTAAATESLRTSEELAGVKRAADTSLSFDAALVYARLGKYEELLAHWPAGSTTRIRLDPRFDKVRADPRFASVLK